MNDEIHSIMTVVEAVGWVGCLEIWLQVLGILVDHDSSFYIFQLRRLIFCINIPRLSFLHSIYMTVS